MSRGEEFLTQREILGLTSQRGDAVELCGDHRIEFWLMIVVVRQGRVDLGQRQMRMLPLHFISVPVMGDPVQSHFNDLGRRPGNRGRPRFINSDVRISPGRGRDHGSVLFQWFVSDDVRREL